MILSYIHHIVLENISQTQFVSTRCDVSVLFLPLHNTICLEIVTENWPVVWFYGSDGVSGFRHSSCVFQQSCFTNTQSVRNNNRSQRSDSTDRNNHKQRASRSANGFSSAQTYGGKKHNITLHILYYCSLRKLYLDVSNYFLRYISLN